MPLRSAYAAAGFGSIRPQPRRSLILTVLQRIGVTELANARLWEQMPRVTTYIQQEEF